VVVGVLADEAKVSAVWGERRESLIETRSVDDHRERDRLSGNAAG
jgi:hypothetical protein